MKRFALTALAVMLATGAMAQGPPARSESIRILPRPDAELNVRVWTQQREYQVGDDIQIYYRTNRDAYVLIFSTSPDGETRQLLPNAYDSENFVSGGQTYSIPNRGYRLEITPPTGRETISIVAFSERYRTMEPYRARKSEVFPKSDGPRAAVAKIIVRPDDRIRNRTYAEDSTTIQVRGRWDRDDRWDRDNRWDNGYWDDRWDRDRGYDYNQRGYGRLSIDSDPGGAYVYVNGQYRGITPLNIGQVRTGSYDIVLNRAGYQPLRKRVRVDEGERERVDENLKLIRYSR